MRPVLSVRGEEEGWRLEMTDVERPDRSPEPIHPSYKKPHDPQHDLMTQAVDGRIRGHVAIRDDLFGRARIMQSAPRRHAICGPSCERPR